ncbi:transposase [Cerasicoccus maritimus]|uniref:transposase n=1 Tax=Cerasicoccus maritimus TaxID=490089 RepID=UPI003CCDF72F
MPTPAPSPKNDSRRSPTNMTKPPPSSAAGCRRPSPRGLTVFSMPTHMRKRLRTYNMCEILNTQIKRRTKVAGLFPNTDSILRLVTAIIMEISEEWETGIVDATDLNNQNSRCITCGFE